MIIKSIRVDTSDTQNIANYFSAQGENEEVEWLMGTPEDVLLMGEASRMCGNAFGVRHVIVSSGQEISEAEMGMAIQEFCQEFNVPDNGREFICAVQHTKKRVEDEGYEKHGHFAIPETDMETGRVLDSKHSKIREEKVSRIVELRLGHKVTPGRFNNEVYRAIAKERPELDLAPFRSALKEANVQAGFKKESWLEYRAYSAFSTNEHQALTRVLNDLGQKTGSNPKEKFNLSRIKKEIRGMAQASDSALALIVAVEEVGYHIQPGRKPGVFRLWIRELELGSVDRLVGRGFSREQISEAIILRKEKKISNSGKKNNKTICQLEQGGQAGNDGVSDNSKGHAWRGPAGSAGGRLQS